LSNTNIKFKIRFSINSWGIFSVAVKLNISILSKRVEDQWKILLEERDYFQA